LAHKLFAMPNMERVEAADWPEICATVELSG